jgi:hypothetical protein
MADADQALQAVSWALSAYLVQPQLSEAAALWQPPASAGGASSMLVGLSRYCRLVGQRFDLRGREAELHLRIIRAMQAQSQGRVPAADAAPAMATLVAPVSSGALVQRFLEAIERQVQREAGALYSAERWRQAVVRHCRGLSNEALQRACDWLWGQTSVLVGQWPARGAGTQLLNGAYVALAEWLGPVRADACFTRVVGEFEGSQDPALVDVRAFL